MYPCTINETKMVRVWANDPETYEGKICDLFTDLKVWLTTEHQYNNSQLIHQVRPSVVEYLVKTQNFLEPRVGTG